MNRIAKEQCTTGSTSETTKEHRGRAGLKTDGGIHCDGLSIGYNTS